MILSNLAEIYIDFIIVMLFIILYSVSLKANKKSIRSGTWRGNV